MLQPTFACVHRVQPRLLIVWLMVGAAGSHAAESWRQSPERMPVVQRGGSDLRPAPDRDTVPQSPAAWIWGPDETREYRLTKTFPGTAAAAILVASCDNRMQLFVNGTQVAASDAWERPVAIDVTQLVRDGDNELAAVVANAGGPAGFSCRLVLTDAAGGLKVIETDSSWSAFDTLTPPAPAALRVVAGPGKGPWGDVLVKDVALPTVPTFNMPPGFRVERLFVVPKDEF